ncbi:MAG: MFS transporter [endosymbiont of Galathealinum brachiosum]|uniref:MFS transporter n=1 Tax=endosymbiont of Galathealinum brachiosum TaxID=2200906 RepID=A0A370DJZ8_9GAMM|nr:MAG: MFS transporter [endosymbiont of Galathealinum brachiosum]
MYKNKSILSWALYDWANSVFATVVIAGFFPVVFKSFWASDLSDSENTFWLGIGNATASLIVVILAPILGIVGDKFRLRKSLLIGFMVLGAVSTSMFYIGQQGDWILALLLYVIATVGFMSANIFYDALLVPVCAEAQIDKVSGFGYGMGYLGGGLSLAICIVFSQQPELLGYDNAVDAVLLCFILVALWWLIFSLPLAIWTQDVYPQKKPEAKPLTSQTIQLFKTVFSNRQTRLFLIAYWIYIDGVDTIIRMAVDYGMALGFETGDLIQALLITQFVGFPAAILYGYIGNRVGVKNALMAGIGVYGIITWLGYNMNTAADFYMLAVLIGLVQGGVQAMSRSYFARMIPDGQTAEYFGIYNMLGKSAAIIGPVMMGGVALITDNHRYSILSVLLLFVVGAVILSRVKSPDS